MLLAIFLAAAACVLLSALSKSSMKWSLLMLAGLIANFIVGSMGHLGLLWIIDLFLMISMVGMRQSINREWQDGVVWLQILIVTSSVVYAVFVETNAWLRNPLIDAGRVMGAVQLVLIGFGATRNSLRNYRYIRNQRKSGNKLPWLLTAWRMT